MAAGSLAFLSVALEGLVESATREEVEKEEALQRAAWCMMDLSKLIVDLLRLIAGGNHRVR